MNTTLIAYRGNFDGDKPFFLNKPDYVDLAVQYGYNVMVDVWYKDDSTVWLGHDSPRYVIDKSFLKQTSLWCNAKTPKTFDLLLCEDEIHCLYLQKDSTYTMTSNGFLLTKNIDIAIEYPKTVLFNPDAGVEALEYETLFGICSNHCKAIREQLEGKSQRDFNMRDARKIIDVVPDLEDIKY